MTDRARTDAHLSPTRLLLLGPFALEGGPIDHRHPWPAKAQALLAYLAAAPGRWHPRPALAALLWPALTPQAAQGNLRQVLLGLRRALPGQPPGPVVEAERTRIRLAEPPPGTIDRADFLELAAQTAGDESPAALAAMQRAVALVRGEFMAQLQLDGCEEFSDWLQAEREHLRRRVLALLERLALRLETLGRYDEAVPFIEQLVALDPLCEPGYAHLMRLLALKGHSVAALQMYQACVRVLEQELGVAPDERTRQLADRIERGALERPIDPPPPGAAVSPPPGRHPATVVAVQFGVDGARDPDALDAPLHRAQAQATARLQAQGGHVVRTPEGGLLAYFGHPRALEDAARRALQAALPLAALPLAPLRTRVGVHSGWIIPEPDGSLPDRVGLTSQVATRLCRRATAGQVIASHDTRRLAEDGFRWKPLGRRTVPHRGTPQPLWQVLDAGAPATPRRQDLRRLTPRVGRQQELEQLAQAWQQALQGQGGALWLRGEAGVGKSRLLHELAQRLGSAPAWVLELACVEATRPVPFRPLAPLLTSRPGRVGAAGGPEAPAGAAAARAAPPSRLGLSAPRWAALQATLGLRDAPDGDDDDIEPLPPHDVIELCTRRVRQLAREKPLLLIVEDLQWCDPSTLSWLAHLAGAARELPLLLMMTSRPDFVPPWPQALAAPLDVAPMPDDAIATLVRRARRGLPAQAVAGIVGRAGGVPLFAEELARAHGQAADGGPGTPVPDTLQQLLAARLDRLEAARTVVQTAAVLGHRFDVASLARALPAPQAPFEPLLQRLLDEGYLSGSLREGHLSFRHALFRDAAMLSLTREDRVAAHARVAQALSEPASRTPAALLAHHWSEAGRAAPAVRAWLRAAGQAHRQGVHREALQHLAQASALLPEVEPEAERVAAAYACHLGEGTAHALLSGYGAAEGARAFAQALKLADAHPGQLDPFPALSGLWFGSASRAARTETRALVQRLAELAGRAGDPVRLQFADYAQGNLHLRLGEFDAAAAHFEAAAARYEPAHEPRLLREFGLNVQVGTLCHLAYVRGITGQMRQARQALARARQIATAGAHPYTVGLASFFEAVLARTRGEVQRTLALAEAGLPLARQHGYAFGETGATLLRGWALAALGRADGIDLMFLALGAAGTQMSSSAWVFVEALADALVRLGRHDDALSVLREGDVLAGHLEDHQVDAELMRLQGECLLRRTPPDRAGGEEALWRALQQAHRQGARLYALRAAAALVKHGAGRPVSSTPPQDLPTDARALLAQLLAAMPEAADTIDARLARELLARQPSASRATHAALTPPR